MNKIIIWIKQNYENSIFFIALSICCLSILIKHELFRWILFYCLIQQSIILFIAIYKKRKKFSNEKFLLSLLKNIAVLFFSVYILLTVYYGYYINYRTIIAFSAFFCICSALIPRKK